jgi:TolB protein
VSDKLRFSIAALAALLTVALSASLAGAAKDETELVSRQSAGDGGAAANGEEGSFAASISANGRFVVFDSDADNLSDEDASGFDVYVRDRETDTTTLVSRQSASDGGAGANGVSNGGSISADGRFVAFQSQATNLSPDATAGQNIFVRDLKSDTTTLVSRESAADGGAGGDDSSLVSRISADGGHVTFVSRADNLSGDDDNAVDNIFVRDLAEETTTLVSRAGGAGGAGGDADSFRPAVSADGRQVAFESEADNLSGADDNAFINVFARDLQTNTTTLVSRRGTAEGGAGNDSSFGASISDDGSRVEFASRADNLSAADDNEFESIFVRDLDAETTTLVSRPTGADGGPVDETSNRGEISGDGRFVGFNSEADNLSAADGDDVGDVFIRDLEAKTTTLVSRQSAADGGAGGNGSSDGARPSADGRFMAFDSEATNLSPLDSEPVSDAYVRDVLGPGGGGGGGSALTLELKAKKRQRAGKPVKVKATCSADCTVEAKGKAKRKGRKKLKLKRAEAELAADETRKLRLKPSRKVARKLRRAGKSKARIKATATDAAGTEATDRVKVKLRPKKR